MSVMVRELGHMPSAQELSHILGSDPSGWGRILKGQCKSSGEYHAKLQRVKEVGLKNAGLEMQAAEVSRKYGWKTRKGRLVPHTRFIAADTELFYINQIVSKKTSAIRFADRSEELHFYREQLVAMYEEGPQWPNDPFEEQTLRRDFINSLP